MLHKGFSTSRLLLGILLIAVPAASAADWTPTSTESKASLRAIVAVSDREVWVSGTQGTVLRTINGGKSWTKMTGLPADLDFRGLQTFDGRIVNIMSAGSGAKSAIYRTSDSGAHWKLVHQNQIPEAFFDCIAFHDSLRGIVIGDPVDGKFFILVTTNSGESWTRLDGPMARDGEGAFAASNTSLVVKDSGLAWFGTGGILGGRVFSSYDWGRTWTAFQTTIPHDSAAAGVFSLAFPDATHGYAVGGDYKKPDEAMGILSETTDAGASWHGVDGPKGYRSAIVIAGSVLVVTGPGGSELHIAHKSKWQTISGPGFNALSRSHKGNRIWACGGDGRVAYVKMP